MHVPLKGYRDIWVHIHIGASEGREHNLKRENGGRERQLNDNMVRAAGQMLDEVEGLSANTTGGTKSQGNRPNKTDLNRPGPS